MDSTSVPAIRRFNRFYTRHIGVLQEGLLNSPLSLTEVRLLYELAHRPGITATTLSQELGLDPGYLSRLLRQFGRRGWIKRSTSAADRRHVLLALTRRGRATLRPLEERSDRQVARMLDPLSSGEQRDLLEAMRRIEEILAPAPDRPAPVLLRPHQPGDLGWIVYRHGVLYAREYRYDERFEALVAEIAAKFIQHFDPARDRCWIAERGAERAGCVMLVHKSATVARLRLLIVEPSARGYGIGRRLVQECIRFARQAGYRKIMLWTQSELRAARGIYQKAGFHLVHEEPHQSWGRDHLVAETWELKL
ncbi:MAG TPA: helix-turn-helix domain-containing GNAT family N-acetyltransferase [Bryobacteraceae bacterium]|nr:helix-turn-helix domain-containing GNAT family N-acetyltransferase [Bryobacteraceae bacterium]